MFAALTGQIVKLGKAKRWAESLQLWADLRARDNSERLVFAKCAVIAACGLATQWQLSLHLISDLPVDDACCCAAISACDKGLEWEQALAVFDQMPRLQLLPSTHSYNATISACTRCARWPRALALFECVPRPNAVVFNTTIAGCGKGQQWHWAMHLFSQMRQAGQRPDAVTYGSLASTFERVSEWEKALALHGEMVSANALDAMSYGALVSACERGRRWHEALDFLREMKRGLLRPGAVVHGVAIGACIKSQRLEEGLVLYRSILAPHHITSSSLVAALAAAGRWAEAVQLASQTQLTATALVAGLSAAETLGDWQAAVEMLSQWRRTSGRPPLRALLRGATAAGAYGEQLLEEAGELLPFSDVLQEHNSAITAAERCR
ncbi:unnamed protein product, partial [Effrenium voratum]